MELRAAEISAILKKQIRNFEPEADIAESGTVVAVGDGVVNARFRRRYFYWLRSLSIATLGFISAWFFCRGAIPFFMATNRAQQWRYVKRLSCINRVVFI